MFIKWENHRSYIGFFNFINIPKQQAAVFKFDASDKILSSWYCYLRSCFWIGWLSLFLPPNSYIEVLGPSTSKYNLIWGYGPCRVKMRSLGWALIQHNWCPCKKGKFEGRLTYRENTMWKWRQPSTSQAEAQNRSFPHCPQKKQIMSTFRFSTSSL